MKKIIVMKKYVFLLAALGLLGVASCQREELDSLTFDKEGAINLTSYRQQVFTRADIDMFDFQAGTKYTLLAVDHDNPANWSSGKGFENLPQYGEEAVASNGVHRINYTPVRQYHKDKSLDFYGLTFNVEGDATPLAAPQLNTPIQDGSTPTITIPGEGQSEILDLMHSCSVKEKNSASGIVTLPFEHALAALNFTVAKQDETNDSETERQLTHVKITKVTLKGVATKATMDVTTGVWTPDVMEDRVVFSSETGAGMDITTRPQAIGPKDMLVFPTYGEQLSVEIELEGLEEYQSGSGSSVVYQPMNFTSTKTDLVVTDGKCTIKYDLVVFDDTTTGQVKGPLSFERNHKYQLAIFVMRNNVRIVAVSPQVYEWQDVALDPATDPRVATLGQPITIGGTVWMDRNIGAKSADCQHDWWHTIGYYYEYARNIPFILDADLAKRNYYVPDEYINISRQDKRREANNQHYLCYKTGSKKDQPVLGNPNVAKAYSDYLVYTYDQNGNKVSKFDTKMLFQYAGYIRNGSAAHNGQYVAINPGDKGSYAYIATSQTDVKNVAGSTGNTGSQESWSDFVENTHMRNYWYSIENQPAPKGWRLPTAKDVYTLMPENNFHWFYNGNRFRQVGVANSVYPKHTTGYALQYAGDYVYQYFYGNFEVDKTVPKTRAWSKPKYKGSGPSDPYQTRIYGIKYPGSAKAYRYMIETHDSDEHNLGYARVYIYPATPNDRFRSDKDEKDAISDDEGTYNLYSSNPQWNLHQFDWDHPSTYIDFPFTGCFNGHYKIYGSDTPHMYLSLFGRDMKYRLMETINMTDNYCMKLSNDGLGFAGTWHSTTGTVRLVRDLESK